MPENNVAKGIKLTNIERSNYMGPSPKLELIWIYFIADRWTWQNRHSISCWSKIYWSCRVWNGYFKELKTYYTLHTVVEGIISNRERSTSTYNGLVRVLVLWSILYGFQNSPQKWLLFYIYMSKVDFLTWISHNPSTINLIIEILCKLIAPQ